MISTSMQKTHPHRHPLGGARSFHNHVTQTSDEQDTTQHVKSIRDILQARSSDQGASAPQSKPRSGKNPFALNNATDAGMYRGVPNRVRSGALLQLGKRTKSRITSIKATKCHRWHTDSELAHTCDVLGPYACSDCTRERMRKQVYDEADRTFPGIEVSERDLCMSEYLGEPVSPQLEYPKKLPPILEAGYVPDTPFSQRTGTNQPSGNHRRNIRKLAPLQKRSVNNTQLLPITTAELQRRVATRKLSREMSNTSSILFTPRGVIHEDTEVSLAPTPRIRVEIQFPLVPASRETSKANKGFSR